MNSTKQELSEIINQKKQFIFDIEVTTQHVYPNEEFIYYVYIKNISGTDISHFSLRISNPDNIVFEETTQELQDITIKNDEVKLYTLKASCLRIGDYIVHFIANGEETELLYKSIKTRCNYHHNQDKLVHKIQVYDFTHYENNYTMEADNFSESVAQIFKRQKLPYKAGKNPFKLNPQRQLDSENTPYNAWKPENIESQSFIDQYNEAKNTKEHVYQYLSRENFTEEALESFVGENLQELVERINNNSRYIKAKFLCSGTNELLNDFTQYKPNGFIYRMGLLSSELYHYLGVVPTYEYMSDYLFRWAPEGQDYKEPLNLYPKKKAMKWDENLWVGRGWIVYRYITEEYQQTDQFKKESETQHINLKEELEFFDDKQTAERYIEKLEYFDAQKRAEIQSDIIQYEYVLVENYNDFGVFFVNIPINKIPANFYLLETEEIYNIIDRTKPFGMKALIRYYYDITFNHNLDMDLSLGYFKNFEYNIDQNITYDITQKKLRYVNHKCEGGNTIQAIREVNSKEAIHDSSLMVYDTDMNMTTNIYPKMNITSDINIENQAYGHIFDKHCVLETINDIIYILYQQNYDNMGFYCVNPKELIDEINIRTFNVKKHNFIKIPITQEQAFNSGNITLKIEITENEEKTHNFILKHDVDNDLDLFYTNIIFNYKEVEKKEGMEDILSINAYIHNIPDSNKKIIIFFVEDKENILHYFNHHIVENIKSVKYYFDVSKLKKTNAQKKEIQNQFKQSLKIRTTSSLDSIKINFETPFCFERDSYQPDEIKEGNNWENLNRINTHTNTFAYIKNLTKDNISPNDIILYYNDINIPETAIIKKLTFKIMAESTIKDIYISKGLNTDYMTEEAKNSFLELYPNKIEVNDYNKESITFYQQKLNLAEYNQQENLIKQYQKLLEESYLFNEKASIDKDDNNIYKYLDHPNAFITINKPFWYELSEFTDKVFDLNEVNSIKFIIEGFNHGGELDITTQVLSELNAASQTTTTIPSGYFRKKIDLLYPNSFPTNSLRIRFKFNDIGNDIKIFDTALKFDFKVKQENNIDWELIETINPNQKNIVIFDNEDDDFEGEEPPSVQNNLYFNSGVIDVFENYYRPNDINNGFCIKLSFDELTQGEFYNINSTELEIIYENTEINMIVNKDKYYYNYLNVNQSLITGNVVDGYLSGEFYNDYSSIGQPKSNIGLNNQGIKLKDEIYQAFPARASDITSIEIFPNGTYGAVDENIKISLHENHGYTPGKVIKEIYANGWTKNNTELRGLPSIQYNFNVDGLKIGETYWIRFKVIKPKKDAYYLLKSFNEEEKDFKLIAKENNNYINTFSCLKFNIKSKNISQSFNRIPYMQETFDNPFVKIGLHKNQGKINNLIISKKINSIFESDYMVEVFTTNPEMCLKIIKHENGNDKVLSSGDNECKEEDD